MALLALDSNGLWCLAGALIPDPQMVVITPTQRIVLYFFPSYLETAFPNYIICVCLAIKAASHHFVALLYSKTRNWCSLLCLAAIECSLLDKAFEEWYSDLGGDAAGSSSAQTQSQTVWSEGPFLSLPRKYLSAFSYTTVICSVKTLFHADNLSNSPDQCWGVGLAEGGWHRSTPALAPHFLRVD